MVPLRIGHVVIGRASTPVDGNSDPSIASIQLNFSSNSSEERAIGNNLTDLRNLAITLSQGANHFNSRNFGLDNMLIKVRWIRSRESMNKFNTEEVTLEKRD